MHMGIFFNVGPPQTSFFVLATHTHMVTYVVSNEFSPMFRRVPDLDVISRRRTYLPVDTPTPPSYQKKDEDKP